MVLLAEGVPVFPLLSEAFAQAKSTQTVSPHSSSPDPAKRVEKICALALCRSEVTVDLLAWSDRLALYSWATAPGVDGAQVDGREEEWSAEGMIPLIKSNTSVLLDAVCKRYGRTPSEMMGVTEAGISNDLDMAVAYRGIRNESSGENDADVDVEDAFGNVHTVPQSWLPDVPEGAKMVDPQWWADNYGEMTLSAGGEGGDGMIGPQNRFQTH